MKSFRQIRKVNLTYLQIADRAIFEFVKKSIFCGVVKNSFNKDFIFATKERRRMNKN